MTNLFQQLKGKYRKRLLSQQDKYSSVSSLIKKLESSTIWTEITISEFNSFCTWADVNTLECSIFDIKYGDKFLKSKNQ